MADEHKMTLRIPAGLHRQAKAKAALQGVTLTAVVYGLLEKWLKEDPPPKVSEKQDSKS